MGNEEKEVINELYELLHVQQQLVEATTKLKKLLLAMQIMMESQSRESH